MIYFIGTDWDSPVKVGKTKDEKKRLSHLQVGNPNELKILKLIRGYGCEEARIHRVLSDYRIRGEWFEGPPVKAFLDNAEWEIIDGGASDYGEINGKIKERLLSFDRSLEVLTDHYHEFIKRC